MTAPKVATAKAITIHNPKLRLSPYRRLTNGNASSNAGNNPIPTAWDWERPKYLPTIMPMNSTTMIAITSSMFLAMPLCMRSKAC